jgi:radical SAM protein with 4Fe4S-binding SPASM domain
MQAVTRGCLAGSSVCFLSRTGEVQPCGYLPLSAGNIREQTLGAIWRESTLFTALRDTDKLTGKCGRCEYRSVCAGCRARAYAVTGDPFAAEPDCTYEPRAGCACNPIP